MNCIVDLVRKPDYDSYGTPEWAFEITATCPDCGAELARVEAGERMDVDNSDCACNGGSIGAEPLTLAHAP